MDDILLADNDFSTIQSLKQLLDQKITIKDLDPIKYYLGLEVQRNNSGIFLSQPNFINELLKIAEMEDCKPLLVPVDSHVKLFDNEKSNT